MTSNFEDKRMNHSNGNLQKNLHDIIPGLNDIARGKFGFIHLL